MKYWESANLAQFDEHTSQFILKKEYAKGQVDVIIFHQQKGHEHLMHINSSESDPSIEIAPEPFIELMEYIKLFKEEKRLGIIYENIVRGDEYLSAKWFKALNNLQDCESRRVRMYNNEDLDEQEFEEQEKVLAEQRKKEIAKAEAMAKAKTNNKKGSK